MKSKIRDFNKIKFWLSGGGGHFDRTSYINTCVVNIFFHEPRKISRENFRKSAREYSGCARERLVTNLPVSPKKSREH